MACGSETTGLSPRSGRTRAIPSVFGRGRDGSRSVPALLQCLGGSCRGEGDLGTIEEIRMRSTRMRGIDRTVTTIPNSAFSRMKSLHLTRRDRRLMNRTGSLRYETKPDPL